MKKNNQSGIKNLLKGFLIILVVCIIAVNIVTLRLYGTRYVSCQKTVDEQQTTINELQEKVETMNDRIVEQDSDILSLTESNEKLKKSNDEYSEKFKKLTKNIKKMEDTYSKKLKKYKTYESKRKISLIASGFKATPTASSLKNFNLKRESLATADELNQYLKGTGLAGLGYYFKYCEAVDGINAVALMSITAVESGWGKSNLAVNKNNILSWCAYDGSAYSSASSFSSMSDCLVKCTPTIAKNYLSTNGKYYNGATLVGMNKNYSSSKNWSSQCANIMADFDKKIK